jgi:hypothetical protein
MSLLGHFALSHQLIENKGSENRFYFFQSRYLTESKTTYKETGKRRKWHDKLPHAGDAKVSVVEGKKAGVARTYEGDTRFKIQDFRSGNPIFRFGTEDFRFTIQNSQFTIQNS